MIRAKSIAGRRCHGVASLLVVFRNVVPRVVNSVYIATVRVSAHQLLRTAAMQFPLDGRVEEPLVPLPTAPRRKRWWRRSAPEQGPPEPVEQLSASTAREMEDHQ